MQKRRFHLTTLIAVLGVSGFAMLLVSVGWSLAAPPPIEHKDWCFDNRDYDCSGAICSCCTNDGCWICDRETWEDCEWDDAYGSRLGGRAGASPLTVSPGGSRPIKPKGQILVPEIPTLQIAPSQ